ncbi:hypothetical protein PENTCL1PPCAC_30015 [Pristionchus entomophagus]|uniref:Uncharacterized protein n=1 Tax=Pristionchus entomophagus TaxID=358040 RepID=A0AAV5UL59_9BILA|nr:hypothetical protein PENTCL1PPCAC_30015 [Pristionchus entomophagus]
MVERRQINGLVMTSGPMLPSTAKDARTHYRSSKMEIVDYSDEELSFEPPLQMTRVRRHAICNDGAAKQELGKRGRGNQEIDKLTESMRSNSVQDATQYVQSVFQRKSRTVSEDSAFNESDTTDGERTRKNSEKEQSDSVSEFLLPTKKLRTN